MELTYNLHIHAPKASWGIHIRLIAEDIIYSYELIPDLISVTNSIYIQLSIGWELQEAELLLLKKGIMKVENEFINALRQEEKIVILVKDIIFDFTDYQPEGLYWAIIGWLANRYHFAVPKVDFEYIKDTNIYMFKNII